MMGKLIIGIIKKKLNQIDKKLFKIFQRNRIYLYKKAMKKIVNSIIILNLILKQLKFLNNE